MFLGFKTPGDIPSGLICLLVCVIEIYFDWPFEVSVH